MKQEYQPVTECQQKHLGCGVILRPGGNGGFQLHSGKVPPERDADEAEIFVGHMVILASQRDLAGGEEQVGGLPYHIAGKSHPVGATAQPGNQATLHVPLDIEDQVIGPFLQGGAH